MRSTDAAVRRGPMRDVPFLAAAEALCSARPRAWRAELDLRQLQYFFCIYEEGSVTRAARKLHVVQPAISMQLQKLESQMGFPLFERTPQGVVPTPEGKAIYELYQPILLDFQDA